MASQSGTIGLAAKLSVIIRVEKNTNDSYDFLYRMLTSFDW